MSTFISRPSRNTCVPNGNHHHDPSLIESLDDYDEFVPDYFGIVSSFRHVETMTAFNLKHKLDKVIAWKLIFRIYIMTITSVLTLRARLKTRFKFDIEHLQYEAFTRHHPLEDQPVPAHVQHAIECTLKGFDVSYISRLLLPTADSGIHRTRLLDANDPAKIHEKIAITHLFYKVPSILLLTNFVRLVFDRRTVFQNTTPTPKAIIKLLLSGDNDVETEVTTYPYSTQLHILRQLFSNPIFFVPSDCSPADVRNSIDNLNDNLVPYFQPEPSYDIIHPDGTCYNTQLIPSPTFMDNAKLVTGMFSLLGSELLDATDVDVSCVDDEEDEDYALAKPNSIASSRNFESINPDFWIQVITDQIELLDLTQEQTQLTDSHNTTPC